jgi:hypothetical protein
VSNSFIYKEDWSVKYQEQLDEKNKYEDICKVDISNKRVFHNPYLTDATVQSGTRGTAYTFQDVVRTDEYVTIDTYSVLPQVIDRADLAQTGYDEQMEMATRQGVKMKQKIEAAVYGDHAAWTNFGAGDITGGTVADTTAITVSPVNIDDIIRHIKRVIRVANGEELMDQYGVFIVWRPADLEILEAFCQANGYQMSDAALKDGISQGFKALGVTHYSSNLLVAGHVFAGVKKQHCVYILKDTWGQIMVDDKDPNLVSGISVVTRADYKVKTWTKVAPVLLDVNVA